MGLHHSGVEILGREYSFASGGGIFDSTPKDAPGAKFRESIELGAFDGGSSELQSAISGKGQLFVEHVDVSMRYMWTKHSSILTTTELKI